MIDTPDSRDRTNEQPRHPDRDQMGQPTGQRAEQRIVDGNADDALLLAYQAALTVASENRLDGVLQRLADIARGVVSARYAAIGVADANGRLLQFITSGMDADVIARIGPLPEGHGLLGALIHDGVPLSLRNIQDDPRSVGFPPNHPPMHSLLGVPILLDGHPIGDLYLTERLDGGGFDENDLAAVQVFAAHAATAIQRANLIAELERSQRKAEAQRDHLQVIIDQLPSGIVIQEGPDRRVERVNLTARRLISGLPDTADAAIADSPSEVGDLPSPVFLQANGAPLPEHEWPDVIATRGDTVSQRQLMLAPISGPAVPVFVQASPLFDADGAIAQTVVVFQDMTRLREAEQLKDDFLSLVSHEFRTPLTAIHGGARLLESQRDSLDAITQRELLVDISQESARLDQMLGNMLRLAETMAGRLEPELEPVLLGPLIQRIQNGMKSRSPDATFRNELPPSLPAVEGDPALLQQVLWNLYENAVKYTPGARLIVTSGDVTEGTVAVHIRDSGIGIAPEHVASVFERFRRPGADPSIRGMGLGLYLCQLLMVAQGGTIWAESEGVGRGAMFSFSLPIATGWGEES